MRTRLVAALFTALSIVVVSAGQAWAGERPDGDGGAFVDPNHLNICLTFNMSFLPM